MLELFDPRTAILVVTLLCGLMALVMNSLRMANTDFVGGLNAWTVATALGFVTALLFGLRGLLPDFLSIVVANGLLLLVYGLYLHGSHAYFGLRMPWRSWALAGLSSMAVVIWFTNVQPSFAARSMVMQLSMIAVNAYHAWFLLSNAKRVNHQCSLGVRLTLISLVVMVLVFVLRFFHLVFVPQADMNLYSSNWIQLIYVLSYSTVLMVVTVGFILMTTERLREAFQHQATHDSLTGLLNRWSVLEILGKEVSRSQRHKRPFALLKLDLGHFKDINDKHGHLVGDEVLRLVVDRMLSTLRADDVLGRLGGEEFLLILPECGKESALVVAERVLAVVLRPVTGVPMVSVSIGLAVWTPMDMNAEVLLERSDRALYMAKSRGRGRVELLES